MKKQFFPAIALTAIIISLASCGNYSAKSVTLKNQIDSINYCVGFNTGTSLKSYYFENDSAKSGIQALIAALDEAYGQSDADQVLNTGKQIGKMFKQMQDEGFVGDSTIKFSLAEAKAGLKAGFNGDFSRFATPDEAIDYVQNIMNKRQMNAYQPDSLKETIEPLSDKETKDLSYALSLYYGNNVKEQFANDTTKKDAKKLASLFAGIDKGMKSNPKYAQFEEIGENLGSSLKEVEKTGLLNDSTIKVNFKLIRQGLINGLFAYDKVISSLESDTYLQQISSKRQAEQNEKLYGENRRAGEAFLAQNAQNAGVITTESGLQYEIVKLGTGAKPTAANTVKVHYHGTTVDGTVFDSSIERGEPVEFGVTQVISGWTEGLQLMP
ncbi:MAG: FKBP-type peptidyl-prolyl cis-trans isomerase, partial [Paludibacter sp.]|nr:FKBP-type peptidyl-prolyl cis-trans isomerase [Paludibacter sp.]